MNRINADRELFQIWKCANVNAVDRSGISDHGEVHIRIVANAALRIVRLLVKGGVEPSVVTHHGLTNEDAEVMYLVGIDGDFDKTPDPEDPDSFGLIPQYAQLLHHLPAR